MGALDSSTTLFSNICQHTEQKIDEHYAKVDAKTISGYLALSDVADSVARVCNVNHTEAVASIHMYLRNRQEFEVRNGKHICRVGGETIKIPMTPKECGLRHYDAVSEYAASFLDKKLIDAEKALPNSKAKLNFQDLCDEIGGHLNLKFYVVYHSLKKFIVDERQDLIIALGRGGGLMRRSNV